MSYYYTTLILYFQCIYIYIYIYHIYIYMMGWQRLNRNTPEYVTNNGNITTYHMSKRSKAVQNMNCKIWQKWFQITPHIMKCSHFVNEDNIMIMFCEKTLLKPDSTFRHYPRPTKRLSRNLGILFSQTKSDIWSHPDEERLDPESTPKFVTTE